MMAMLTAQMVRPGAGARAASSPLGLAFASCRSVSGMKFSRLFSWVPVAQGIAEGRPFCPALIERIHESFVQRPFAFGRPPWQAGPAALDSCLARNDGACHGRARPR